jgi:hypothetical protein
LLCRRHGGLIGDIPVVSHQEIGWLRKKIGLLCKEIGRLSEDIWWLHEDTGMLWLSEEM